MSGKSFPDGEKFPSALPAHVLWVELATRIAANGLHYRSGNEETAAISIYKLFPKVRELMEKHPGAAEFHAIALRLLNETLRPYTARWHGWMNQGDRVDAKGEGILEFRDEAVRRKFRQELQELREKVQGYKRACEALAKGVTPDLAWLPAKSDRTGSPLAGPLASKLRTQVKLRLADKDGRGAVPIAPQIEDAEHAEIARRRRIFSPATAEGPLVNAIGLALSGGGIRSATFCLGVVQALQRRRLFEKVDYLSTVSGGGYLGSFLSCYLGTEAGDDPRKRLEELFPEKKAGARAEPEALRHLRNNSRYLLGGGVMRILGIVVSGFLTSLLVLLLLPLLFAWAVYFFIEVFPGENGTMILFKFASVVLLAGWLLLPLVRRLACGQPEESRKARFAARWAIYLLWWVLPVVALGLVAFAPEAVRLFERLIDLPGKGLKLAGTVKIPEVVTVILTALVPAISAALTRRKDGSVRGWARLLFEFSTPLFFLTAFVIFASHLGLGGRANPPLVFYGVLTLGLLVWAWMVDINLISPHNYYRNQLGKCYLIRHGAAEVETVPHVPLADLGKSPAAPYHLINANLNAHTSRDPELRGRNGDFFLLSRHYCGSPLTGYVPTEDLVALDSHVDLGTAMAISGAAVGPNSGPLSEPRTRFLKTLFNIRLGYWLPRPGCVGTFCKWSSPGPVQLFRELFGRLNVTSKFVNLSDGGHIENLATYELIRRQCKFIVCVDAGMEPGMECADLTRLQRYVAIDFGVEMHFDPTDLTLLPTRYSRAYAVLVKIDYAPEKKGNRETSDQLGWMLYLKLAVTGTEPRYVLDYRRQNPEFPHQTTSDQFYDEAQFEAYRVLGKCAGNSLFRREITGGKEPAGVEEWFGMLADSLLPDNDEVFEPARPVSVGE